MAQARFSFPRNFIWGTATSAYQVEGQNTNNNWYAWERSGQIMDRHTCGQACDWWGGRWREDFDRAAEAGQNAHRFSLEWSRIQPTPDRWDESALDHYREMARGLLERGMQPMVTLHHFTEPMWFSEMGSWQNPQTVALFDTFVRRAVEALQEYVRWWCTINEPNVLVALSYLMGDFPTGQRGWRAAYQATVNLIRSHAAAYASIHEIQPDARVGMAHNHRGFSPAKGWSPLDQWLTRITDQTFNQAIPRTLHDGRLRFLGVRKRIPEAQHTQDFLGVNYYTSENIAFNLKSPGQLFMQRDFPEGAELSPTGFIANLPRGFFQTLKWAKGFGLPIIVTENGIEDSDDTLRPKYLIEHIHQLWHAVNFNWKIQGYFHWSLVDNFEWERGWTQRFGLWGLDTRTQERIKRASVDLYTAICQENALSSEVVARFAPELSQKLFPG